MRYLLLFTLIPLLVACRAAAVADEFRDECLRTVVTLLWNLEAPNDLKNIPDAPYIGSAAKGGIRFERAIAVSLTEHCRPFMGSWPPPYLEPYGSQTPWPPEGLRWHDLHTPPSRTPPPSKP